MEPHAQHLQLVFLASTVTPAWAAGWAFTTTPAPRPRPVRFAAAPVHVRLAVISA
ncbi:hypothetical protein [Hymenobacter convexus]|uniref:hypothetical protein n=1 Tax=Hymenobacter sp. CA1UV-4 TaxID=3063782 RepID=UPI0027129A3B|nr:hypothetical protein [Hymenobacter sp. CA1UV-4]MDO7854305.1 hypothetical protein [Hymenobacter sp. CA1UV-4]